MSPPRMISLAEAVCWFAWDKRFTAEEFLAADRLKVSAGEILLYNQYIKEGKMPKESAKALKIYQGAVAADQKIVKRIKEALRHSSISTTLVYARLGADPARQAMEEHGRRIMEVAGRQRVVETPRQKE